MALLSFWMAAIPSAVLPSQRFQIRCSYAASSVVKDAALIRRAAEVADLSAGLTAPHPNFGCVLARGSSGGEVVGEGFLYAQGTKCAELQAVEAAGELARGATAYLNMEPGDCYGDRTPVSSLVQAGISRVVVGLRHPLQHLRGKAIEVLRNEGIEVDILGETLQSKMYEEALKSCLIVNAPLLYRAVSRVPYSVLKYAMTLDGKIAASSGDACWVSSKVSRNRVFELRGRSDAIIVGGSTVRRDNPRLTARHGGDHVPIRIVMSQTCDLPEEAILWNVSDASTVVATQRGARRDLQKKLALKGVEVVEFDHLNPRDVMAYFYERGYLSILWECGGNLAAPAISAGVVHKVYAFVAPKIIGGVNAPTPVGDLGNTQMSQACNLKDVYFEQDHVIDEEANCEFNILVVIMPRVLLPLRRLFFLDGEENHGTAGIGPDMLISGYIQPIPDPSPAIPSFNETSAIDPTVTPYDTSIISFYKTWDPYGAFSNFSPHPIRMPDENGAYFIWPTVEHYYQAHKFIGAEGREAKKLAEKIKFAKSPEEAALLGRKAQKQQPELVRSDWELVKIDVMYRALQCKFYTYPYLSSMLCSTAGSVLVEASPHDLFWGGGRDGEGLNYLGRLLMKLRIEIMEESSVPVGS